MAQGDWTKEEAKASLDAVEEIWKALPNRKKADFIGHLNDIALFLGRAQRELPSESVVARQEAVGDPSV